MADLRKSARVLAHHAVGTRYVAVLAQILHGIEALPRGGPIRWPTCQVGHRIGPPPATGSIPSDIQGRRCLGVFSKMTGRVDLQVKPPSRLSLKVNHARLCPGHNGSFLPLPAESPSLRFGATSIKSQALNKPWLLGSKNFGLQAY